MSERIPENSMSIGSASPYPAYGSMQLSIPGEVFPDEQVSQATQKLKDALKKANAERRQLLGLVERFAARYQEDEKTVKQLQRDLNNTRKINDDLHSNVQVYDSDLHDLEEKHEQLVLDFSKKDSELTERMRENQRLSDAAHQIQENMNSVLQENQQLRHQLKEIEDKYSATKMQLESYGFANSEIQRDYRTMEEKVARLQREKTQLENRCSSLLRVNEEMISEQFHSFAGGDSPSAMLPPTQQSPTLPPTQQSPTLPPPQTYYPPPPERRQNYASLPAVPKVPPPQAAQQPQHAGTPPGRSSVAPPHECPVCHKQYPLNAFDAFKQHVDVHFFD